MRDRTFEEVDLVGACRGEGWDVPLQPRFLSIPPAFFRSLQSCELDLAEDILLDFFSCRTCFTPEQKLLIERMEEDHGLADDF